MHVLSNGYGKRVEKWGMWTDLPPDETLTLLIFGTKLQILKSEII